MATTCGRSYGASTPSCAPRDSPRARSSPPPSVSTLASSSNRPIRSPWPCRNGGRCRRWPLRTDLGERTMTKPEEKYIVALDIGTSKGCVLVGEVNDRGQLEIIGKGTTPLKGARRGHHTHLHHA